MPKNLRLKPTLHFTFCLRMPTILMSIQACRRFLCLKQTRKGYHLIKSGNADYLPTMKRTISGQGDVSKNTVVWHCSDLVFQNFQIRVSKRHSIILDF